MNIDYENLLYFFDLGQNQYRFDLIVIDLMGLEDIKLVIVIINDVDEFVLVFIQKKYVFEVFGNVK